MADKGGRRGEYAKSEQRRRDIIAAAVEVFSESGFRDGALRDVADRAGITHAAIRYHFPTKVDLLEAVLRWRDDRALAVGSANHPDGIGVLRAWLAEIRHNRETPGLVTLEATDGRAIVTMNTMTAEDGSYRFEGLRAGTYQITQRQPAACINDGATQVISDVVVGANEEIADQNFAEGWLRPQYVSIGLFLASTIKSSPTTYGWSVGLREKMARAEEAAGNVELAEAIRFGEVVEFAQRGWTMTITGTRADELFVFQPGALESTVTIGGTPYHFDPADVRRFKIVGGGGSDSAELSDSTGDDRLEGRYNWAKLSSDEFTCELLDFDWITAESSNGGVDTTDIESTIDYLLETVGNWT